MRASPLYRLAEEDKMTDQKAARRAEYEREKAEFQKSSIEVLCDTFDKYAGLEYPEIEKTFMWADEELFNRDRQTWYKWRMDAMDINKFELSPRKYFIGGGNR